MVLNKICKIILTMSLIWTGFNIRAQGSYYGQFAKRHTQYVSGGSHSVVEYDSPANRYRGQGNNGSINATPTIIIQLTGDTFNDTGNDDLLDVGSQVTLGNVPAGLSPVLSLSDNDTRITVTFTGKATDHQPMEDVADITFSFDDSAFSSALAASVSGSGNANLHSSSASIHFNLNPGLRYGQSAIQLSTATYAGAGEEFSVSAQESLARGLTFNRDGSKMFVIGASGDAIVEYDLSSPYDISTATYAGLAEEFSVSAQESIPTGLTFNDDGSKLFVIGSSGDAVVEYALSVNFDVSKATYAGASEEFSVNAQDGTPTGLAFNHDGSVMYIIGSNNDRVFQYNLSTSFDVSTATYNGENLGIQSQETSPTGLVFNEDGTEMYLTGSSGDAVVQYRLTTPFDVTTAGYTGISQEFSVASEETSPQDLFFDPVGKRLLIPGSFGAIAEYHLTPDPVYAELFENNGEVVSSSPLVIQLTGDTFNDTGNDDLLNVGSQVTLGNVPAGLTPVLTLSDNDTRATLTFTGAATAHNDVDDVADITFAFDDSAFSSATAASVTNSGETSPFSSHVPIDFLENVFLLQYGASLFDVSGASYTGAAEEFSVNGQENNPSGLTFNNDGTVMYIIGSAGGAVIEYTLTAPFDVSTATHTGSDQELSVSAQENVPSGLSFNTDGSKMFVIGSSGDAVVEYHLSASFDLSTASYAGAGEEFSVSAQESAPSGLAFNTDGSKMFVIGVGGDAVVEYHLSVNFDVSTAIYAGAGEEFFVGTEESTPTGLAFNHDGSKLFILGNSGDAVVEYTLSVNFDVSTAIYAGAGREFFVGTEENIPQALAFSSDGGKMFVVGATGDAVVEYELPDAEYTESFANDGSINNSNSLLISLTGDTFDDTGNDGLLNVGSQVTLGNIPAGLTPVLTLSEANTRVTLTFTGKATSHQNIDDISGITFQFDDSAFSTIAAAEITNSGQPGAFNSPAGIDFDDNPLHLDYGSTQYLVREASYPGIGEEFSVSDQETDPQGLAFNDLGTRMYVVGSNSDAITEYVLSTPFDVSTASYAGLGEEFFVGTQDVAPTGLAFSNDGSKMFIAGATDDAIVEYHLATPYDISTATYAGAGEEFSVASETSTPVGLTFNHDGSKMFVVGSAGVFGVIEYSLATGFDVSTASLNSTFTVSAEENSPRGMAFNDDGTEMFIIGFSGDAVVRYNLAIGFDISTASYAGAGEEFVVGSEEPSPQAMAFSSTGSKLFVLGGSRSVVEYDLPANRYTEQGNDGSINATPAMIIQLTGDTFNDTGNDDLLNAGSQVSLGNVPAGLTPVLSLSDNDTRVTVTFTGNAADHQPTDNVADITFSFDDSAFSTISASEIANSGHASPHSTNASIHFNLNPGLRYGQSAIQLSTATYAGAGEEFSVSAQESTARGLAFNRDGSKMFVIGASGDAIVEYDLTSPYDISTATYAGLAEEFSVGAQESIPTGLTFNDDGSKLFVIGTSGDAVVEYALSVNFDVSTATYAGAAEEFSVNAQEGTPTGLAFNHDGSVMYIIGNNNDRVFQYNLSTSFDVSTATYNGENLGIQSQESSPTGLVFNENGTEMYLTGTSGDAVVQYRLTTPFDVTTASYTGAGQEFSVASEETIPQDLFFDPVGKRLLILGSSGAIAEYHLTPAPVYEELFENNGEVASSSPLVIQLTGNTFNDTGNDDQLNVGSQVTLGNVPAGLTPILTLSDNDIRATLTFTGAATAHNDVNDVADITFAFDDSAFSSAIAADVSNSGHAGPFSSHVPIDFLENVFFLQYGASLFNVSGASYTGAAEEFSVFSQESIPQGLTFNNDGTVMYIIGSTGDAVVEYTLTAPFDVSTATHTGSDQEFSVGAQENVPSGLAFNTDGSKMFVIGSSGDAVVEYHLSANFDVSTASYAGAGEEFSVSAQESAPSGLAFNTDGSKMFVIGSSGDAVVEYHLSVNFDVSTAIYAGAGEEFFVGTEESTPTGLAFNHDGSKLFILGNSGDAVVEYTLSVNFDVSTAIYAGAGREFFVGTEENIPQALAFSSDGGRMFVVGATGDAVVEYELPDAEYTETFANDGSINNSNSLLISLTGDTFNDTGNDGLLNVGSQVTLGNIPAGLTPVLTLSEDDTRVTLTFTGNATSHQNIDDISGITFQFDDSAFSTIAAAEITNSGQPGAFNSPAGIDFDDNALHLDYGSPQYLVREASYSGISEEFSVSDQETDPQGLAFNDLGTRMYVVGSNSDAITEYVLSTPFDVSTASYAGVSEEFSVSAQDVAPTGLAFSNDGSKMFIAGATDDAIVEYHLATPYDISTATYAGAGEEFSVASETSTPVGLTFNHDGSKMFVVGSAGVFGVIEYSLATGFDVSTASLNSTFSVSAEENSPRGMAFNDDGTEMFIIGFSGDAVVRYNLAIGFDISTASYAGAGEEFVVGSEEPSPQAMAFSSTGSKLFVLGGSRSVVEYDLPANRYTEQGNDGSINATPAIIIQLTGDTFNDTGNDDLLNAGSQVSLGNVPAGLTPVLSLSDNDTRITVTFTGNATDHQPTDNVADITFSFDDSAFSSALAASVSGSGHASPHSTNASIHFNELSLAYGTFPTDITLTSFSAAFSVTAQESIPSGMTFNNDGLKLFVIGINGDAIVEYDLTIPFDVSTASYAGDTEVFFVGAQETIPTGLTFNDDGSKLFVIGSIGDAVVEYALSVNFDVSTAIYAGAVEEFSVSAQEVNPQALAFNHDGSKMYITGLSNDAVFQYDLSTNFDVSTATYNNERLTIQPQEGDPTGIAFTSEGHRMFITGDDAGVVQYVLTTAYDVTTATHSTGDEFSIVNEENQPEDIAFSRVANRLFVTGTGSSSVVAYDIATYDWVEASVNNGTLEPGTSLVIDLTGDTFDDTGSDNLLNIPGQVSIGNVPIGLTPVLTLSGGNTRATLTFTGAAANHNDVHDVEDLTFSFDNSAFSNTMTSDVMNSGASTPHSSLAGIDFDDNPLYLDYGSTAYDVINADYAGIGEEFSVVSRETAPTGLAFNHDGTRVFITGLNRRSVIEYRLITPFDISTAQHEGAIEEFSVSDQESGPQDIAFSDDGSKMFVIGTFGSAVVEYNLSVNFDVSSATYAGAAEEFLVSAQENTPTGLAFNGDGSKMFVIGTGGDAVVEYHLSVNFDVSTATYAGAAEEFFVGAQENTPTGLTFNHDGSELFVIGSSGDAVVPYHLSVNFDVSTAVYAGASEERFIGAQENNPAAIAFSNSGSKLFILGTSDDAILEYQLPTNQFNESEADDGSVTNEYLLVVQLTGDTFDDTGNDDLLDLSAQVTINNVPAGLTPVLSLSDNDTRLTIMLEDHALNHRNPDDVSDLTFVFHDAAFVNTPAASVQNSGSGSAHSSNSGIDFFNGAPGGIEADLALWLRSDFSTGSATDGASLSTWVGQSAAAVQASQGVPANQPVFHDNAIDNLNFNPVVSFDGTNGFLELPDGIVASGDDALGFYAVWNTNADNATQRILSLGSTTSGSGLALQLGSSGNAGLQLEVAPNNQGLLVPYSINTTALLTANTQALSGNDVMVALAGAAFSTGTVGNTNRSLTSSDNYLGQSPAATERFNGQIAEIIVYNEPQSASERQRVESYLALKYGITLSNDNDGDGTPFEAAGINEGDYVASDELTVFWDAGANASYHNNIAGIVRDDGSDLEQKQSRSSNADALVTMGLDDDTNGPEQTNSANSGSFQADLSALVWGHDGEALYDNDENIDFDPVQVASRLNREWRVQETGTVGTVVVQFDVSNLEGPQGPGTSDESQIVLLVDNDSDFSAGASLVLQASVTNNDGLVNFRVDFNDGQYFTLASSEENALPITLISFDVEAHNDHVLLKWSTASEVNNSLFRIERSEDGSHFRSIGFKEGAGNSQSLEEYSFLDRQPQPGNNYYRLVDIDNQGNEHVSEIRRLYFETEEALLSLYPNPIQQNNLLKFKSSDPSLHDIRIIVDSAHGQRILDRVEAGKSYQELSIDTHTWTPGIYMLRVYEDGHLYKGPVKIVKQH